MWSRLSLSIVVLAIACLSPCSAFCNAIITDPGEYDYNCTSVAPLRVAPTASGAVVLRMHTRFTYITVGGDGSGGPSALFDLNLTLMPGANVTSVPSVSRYNVLLNTSSLQFFSLVINCSVTISVPLGASALVSVVNVSRLPKAAFVVDIFPTAVIALVNVNYLFFFAEAVIRLFPFAVTVHRGANLTITARGSPTIVDNAVAFAALRFVAGVVGPASLRIGCEPGSSNSVSSVLLSGGSLISASAEAVNFTTGICNSTVTLGSAPTTGIPSTVLYATAGGTDISFLVRQSQFYVRDAVSSAIFFGDGNVVANLHVVIKDGSTIVLQPPVNSGSARFMGLSQFPSGGLPQLVLCRYCSLVMEASRAELYSNAFFINGNLLGFRVQISQCTVALASTSVFMNTPRQNDVLSVVIDRNSVVNISESHFLASMSPYPLFLRLTNWDLSVADSLVSLSGGSRFFTDTMGMSNGNAKFESVRLELSDSSICIGSPQCANTVLRFDKNSSVTSRGGSSVLKTTSGMQCCVIANCTSATVTTSSAFITSNGPFNFGAVEFSASAVLVDVRGSIISVASAQNVSVFVSATTSLTLARNASFFTGNAALSSFTFSAITGVVGNGSVLLDLFFTESDLVTVKSASHITFAANATLVRSSFSTALNIFVHDSELSLLNNATAVVVYMATNSCSVIVSRSLVSLAAGSALLSATTASVSSLWLSALASVVHVEGDGVSWLRCCGSVVGPSPVSVSLRLRTVFRVSPAVRSPGWLLSIIPFPSSSPSISLLLSLITVDVVPTLLLPAQPISVLQGIQDQTTIAVMVTLSDCSRLRFGPGKQRPLRALDIASVGTTFQDLVMGGCTTTSLSTSLSGLEATTSETRTRSPTKTRASETPSVTVDPCPLNVNERASKTTWFYTSMNASNFLAQPFPVAAAGTSATAHGQIPPPSIVGRISRGQRAALNITFDDEFSLVLSSSSFAQSGQELFLPVAGAITASLPIPFTAVLRSPVHLDLSVFTDGPGLPGKFTEGLVTVLIHPSAFLCERILNAPAQVQLVVVPEPFPVTMSQVLSARAAGAIAAVVALLPSTALSTARTTTLYTLARCGANLADDDGTSLTGVRIGPVSQGQYARGALVGNVVVLLGGTTLVVLLFSIGLSSIRARRCVKSGTHTLGAELQAHLSRIGFPGLVFPLACLILPCTATAALTLLVNHPLPAADIAQGCVGVALVVCFIGALYYRLFVDPPKLGEFVPCPPWCPRHPVDYSLTGRIRQLASWLAHADGKWQVRSKSLAYRYRSLFESSRVPWFSFFDCACTALCAAACGVQVPDAPQALCEGQLGVSLVVNVAYLWIHGYVQPLLQRADRYVAMLLSASGVCSSAAALFASRSGNDDFNAVSAWITLVSSCVADVLLLPCFALVVSDAVAILLAELRGDSSPVHDGGAHSTSATQRNRAARVSEQPRNDRRAALSKDQHPASSVEALCHDNVDLGELQEMVSLRKQSAQDQRRGRASLLTSLSREEALRALIECSIGQRVGRHALPVESPTWDAPLI